MSKNEKLNEDRPGDRGRHIVGDKRTNGERDEYDFYPTPRYVTKELLDLEEFATPIWEPAAGAGHISLVLENAGYDVISTELQDEDFVYGTGGTDFLEENRTVPTIITNPPFKLAQDFIEHAVSCATEKVAIFAKLVLLESASRYQMFEKTPLKSVYVFSKRVKLSKYGEEVSGSSMVAYAWFVWEIGYEGPPQIDWILAEPTQGTGDDLSNFL